MSIKRYDLGADGLGNWWQCSEDGEFVRYEDHAAEVERLAAPLRTLLSMHDAEVFVREPWDITFNEARAALAGEGDKDE